jgi:hypothetical protein
LRTTAFLLTFVLIETPICTGFRCSCPSARVVLVAASGHGTADAGFKALNVK